MLLTERRPLLGAFSLCDLREVSFQALMNAGQVSVPVGNSEHTHLVVAVTTLVTSGATIYLVISMFRQIKQKTE